MREIIVLAFVSLDGVMQAPGGPEEDPSGGFRYGGWMFPYSDTFLGEEMGRQMSMPYDLLLGRKTYEIFSAYWPLVDPAKEPLAGGLNRAHKYVVSTTLEKSLWDNSTIIRSDAVAEIHRLKEGNGPVLQVHGSGKLVQTLLKNDLVDQLWLKIFPLTLGPGKRLFAEGTIPAAFRLERSGVSPNGVIVASYRREGAVRTGSFAG